VHVRQESTGSVSSLGSVDRDLDSSARSQQQRRGFFQRMNPFRSPKQQQKQPHNSLTDFHQLNQAFLSTVETSQPVSPTMQQQQQQQQQRLSLSSMDRPPASRGGHRRLASIDNDDWEDGDGKEQKRPKQSKKSSSRRRRQQQRRQERLAESSSGG
jgi:hypothetical protein